MRGKPWRGKKINFISKYLTKGMDSEANIPAENTLKVLVSIEYIKKRKKNVENTPKRTRFSIWKRCASRKIAVLSTEDGLHQIANSTPQIVKFWNPSQTFNVV